MLGINYLNANKNNYRTSRCDCDLEEDNNGNSSELFSKLHCELRAAIFEVVRFTRKIYQMQSSVGLGGGNTKSSLHPKAA
jgi:hypothetical protein